MANPNILLSGRPAQIDSPLEAEARGMSFAQMAQAGRMNEIKLREAAQRERDEAEDRQADQIIGESFIRHKGDYDKIRAEVAPKIPLRKLRKWDADHLQVQQARSAMKREERAALDAMEQAKGAEAAALLELPYPQRIKMLPRSIEVLKQKGVPEETLLNFDPSDENLRYVIASAGYAGKVASYEEKQEAERQKKAAADKAQAETKNLDAKGKEESAQRLREEVDRRYQKVIAAPPDQKQALHDAWLASIPQEIAADYAGMTTYTPETARAVADMALTAQQRATNEYRNKDKSLTPIEVALEYGTRLHPNDRTKALDAALKRFSETTKEGKFEPNQAKVGEQQRKEWLKAYDKAAKDEATLYDDLARLDAAIASGETYIYETGRAVPMEEYTKGNADRAPGATQAMKDRANGIRNKIKTAIRDKYANAERLGFTGDVDVTTAIRAIEEGKYKGGTGKTADQQSPQQAQPAARPAATGGRGSSPASRTQAPAKQQQTNQGGTAQATAPKRPRAEDGKGNVVEWDGTAWIPVQRK